MPYSRLLRKEEPPLPKSRDINQFQTDVRAPPAAARTEGSDEDELQILAKNMEIVGDRWQPTDHSEMFRNDLRGPNLSPPKKNEKFSIKQLNKRSAQASRQMRKALEQQAAHLQLRQQRAAAGHRWPSLGVDGKALEGQMAGSPPQKRVEFR